MWGLLAGGHLGGDLFADVAEDFGGVFVGADVVFGEFGLVDQADLAGVVEFAPDLPGGGDGTVADPGGFGFHLGFFAFGGVGGGGGALVGENGASADAGEVLFVALDAAAPVALLFEEVVEAVLEVVFGEVFGEFLLGDLVDFVEVELLAPGDGGVAAECEVDVSVDAFEVRRPAGAG